MSVWYYHRGNDDFLRSIESGFVQTDKVSFQAQLRDYFPVKADDGTRIHIPLRFLANIAEIYVSGNCDCTLQGTNSFVVEIVNGKQPSPAKKAAKVYSEYLLEDAAERVAESQTGRILGKVQPIAQKLAGEVRQGLQLAQRQASKLAKGLTSIGTKISRLGLAEGLGAMIGSTGTIGMSLEADDIGFMASHSIVSENGCDVQVHISGLKPVGP